MNTELFILMLMILGHLLADYPLQGWLAQAKAKSYWENTENKYDYIAALVCHSLMWSILVFIPFTLEYLWIDWFWLAIPINAIVHCVVDDLKANKKRISLCEDQLIHLCQIIITWLVGISLAR